MNPSAMLPEPTLSLTLPSLHDGTVLDCRVYHPASLHILASPPPQSPSVQHGDGGGLSSSSVGKNGGKRMSQHLHQNNYTREWAGHAAVVAHPYAPLGGCYDDPVVSVVAGVLLRLGFVVVTFNFRGATGSAGRTSWTARPERADYMTVAGFAVYYAHHLDPTGHSYVQPTTTPLPPLSPHDADSSTPSPSPSPLLVLAGYSYGAMVTTLLPPLPSILDTHFRAPPHESPAAEVRLRALHLAEQQNAVLAEARRRQKAAMEEEQGAAKGRSGSGSGSISGQLSPRRALAAVVRVGGDEESRKSHDSGRGSHCGTGGGVGGHGLSFDMDGAKVKAQMKALVKKGRGGGLAEAEKETAGLQEQRIGGVKKDGEEECLPPLLDLRYPRVAYVLVSPLQGVVTNLATMSFGGLSSPSSSVSGALSGFFSKRNADAPTGGKLLKEKPKTKSSGPSSQSTPSPTNPLPTNQANNDGATPNTNPSTASNSDADSSAAAERKLHANPCLAVFGDQDVFVAARKLREWSGRLGALQGSRFRAREVTGAGHFWTEGRVLYTLRDEIRGFVEGLTAGREGEGVEGGYEPL